MSRLEEIEEARAAAYDQGFADGYNQAQAEVQKAATAQRSVVIKTVGTAAQSVGAMRQACKEEDAKKAAAQAEANAHAKELVLRFEAANSRPPEDMQDMEAWFADDHERPITPQREVLEELFWEFSTL